ncbi:MAG: twin-arginine translocase TatA/TatE family subunit [Helicobacter sp.]|nr:twin-arginine translocase TatA/TatE family subunit [Helicobacter sp.]
MGFGSIWHWLIVLLVIILLFGARRIPEIAKGLGSGIRNFKKALNDDKDEIEAKIEPKAIKSKKPRKPKS